MFNIAVFISGKGSNLAAIIKSITAGKLAVEIKVVISDNPNAAGLELAKSAGIPTEIVQAKNYIDRIAYAKALLDCLKQYSLDLIVLAGFMRILDKEFIQNYAGKIINIHPSLLPKYKGLDTHAKVLQNQDQNHGCTIHFVTEDLDSGPIIAQSIVPVLPEDTEELLKERVQIAERQLYPEVIGYFAAGKVKLESDQVYLDGKKL